MDTSLNYVDEFAFFSSDERRWINRMYKLAEEHPNEVEILEHPEKNHGCIYVLLPSEWLWIGPRPKRNLTDEQRRELSERMKRINENNQNPSSEP